jgi:hypothetical protein
MDQKQDVTLESLASLSLAKCLLRMSRVTAGTWQVTGTHISSGTLLDALKRHDFTNRAAAVYFNLRGISPMTAVMAFDANDLECVSKCFTGHSFPRGGAITPAEEIMLTELGNIVLNALMNAVTNALKKSSMPAMPLFAEGDIAAIAAAISTQVNPNQLFRIIATTIVLKSDTATAKAEVLLLLPEELAMELELLRPSLGA